MVHCSQSYNALILLRREKALTCSEGGESRLLNEITVFYFHTILKK